MRQYSSLNFGIFYFPSADRKKHNDVQRKGTNEAYKNRYQPAHRHQSGTHSRKVLPQPLVELPVVRSTEIAQSVNNINEHRDAQAKQELSFKKNCRSNSIYQEWDQRDQLK